MRITKEQMVAGQPAELARRLMRAYRDPAESWQAAEILDASEAEAVHVLNQFCSAGYLTTENISHDEPSWITTVTGNSLAQASFTKPIKRATAERHLQGVIERAATYNADPSKLLTVTRLIVFGSYLDSTQHTLGDLDLGIQVVRRIPGDEWSRRSSEYSAKSGKHFARFIDKLVWPSRELLMLLKNRSSAINITDEDISQLTDQHECVYDVDNDEGAIPPPEGAMVHNF